MPDPTKSPAAQPPADDAVESPVHDPVIGAILLGFEVKALLGAGGMGIVYLAEQTTIGKRAAIKVLRPDFAERPEAVEALVSEARSVNRIRHRGIVDVFGFGVLPDGRQYMAMELLEGESLSELLRRQSAEGALMPVGEALLILEQVLSALTAVHAAGVVHRDLKPSNIFLVHDDDGSRYVKILDFGTAFLLADRASSRAPRGLVGTPAYMAPEAASRGPLGPALDLYAVGVIAFELLTNRRPFEGESTGELLLQHASTPAPRPSQLLMSIPDELDELVLSLLAKQPGERPVSARKVRLEVKRARKLLQYSTNHPDLVLTRDKPGGKLALGPATRADRPPLGVSEQHTRAERQSQSSSPGPTRDDRPGRSHQRLAPQPGASGGETEIGPFAFSEQSTEPVDILSAESAAPSTEAFGSDSAVTDKEELLRLDAGQPASADRSAAAWSPSASEQPSGPARVPSPKIEQGPARAPAMPRAAIIALGLLIIVGAALASAIALKRTIDQPVVEVPLPGRSAEGLRAQLGAIERRVDRAAALGRDVSGPRARLVDLRRKLEAGALPGLDRAVAQLEAEVGD